MPQGYHVLRPATFRIWVAWRSFLVDGDPNPGVATVMTSTSIYPLAQAANPPPPTFVNLSGSPFSMVGDATARALAFRMRERQ